MSPPYLPDGVDDEELTRQLEHLDALEKRESERRTLPGHDLLRSMNALPRQPRWPAGISPAPGPAAGSTSLTPLINWLEFACSVLEARVEMNSGELERLHSQWVHVLANLQRLRPEELDGIVESQAQVREALANDAALHDVLRSEHRRLIAWASVMASPVLADPALVRRLLDDVTSERIRVAGEVAALAVDLLGRVSLEVEVVRRTLARDPGLATRVLEELQDRVTRTAERLRDQSTLSAPAMQQDEPLVSWLRRVAQRHAGRIRCTVRWEGADIGDAGIAAAVRGIVEECVAQVAAEPGSACEIHVMAPPVSPLTVCISTTGPALSGGGLPGWLVRARARAALDGGQLSSGPAGSGSILEVRFPG